VNNKQNLHTHTTYCDGKDTPAQMIAYAMDKGFDSLGFSGHSYMFYSPDHSMSLAGTEQYKNEIAALKTQYRDRLPIFLGLEVDMYSQIDLNGYDYLLGACHYLKLGDAYIGFDRSSAECRRIVDTYFAGNGLAFAKEYYRQLADLPQYGKFDILAHVDLVTKTLEQYELFDWHSKDYLTAAIEAIDALRDHIPFFEVNTGAIARGYRTAPYPTETLLRELRLRGFGATISSDCHDGQQLDCGFNDAVELLGECGYTERYILTEAGFDAVELR
jgi:histidinol-phosphatase (PHP family)